MTKKPKKDESSESEEESEDDKKKSTKKKEVSTGSFRYVTGTLSKFLIYIRKCIILFVIIFRND